MPGELSNTEFTFKVIELAISGATLLITFTVAILGYRLAHQYWRKQKKEEINYQLEANRDMCFVNAHTAAWSLLRFIAENENPDSAIIFNENNGKRDYYLVVQNAKKLLGEISEQFYVKGHGLFLTTSTKDKIFHIRGIVYGLLLSISKSAPNESRVLVKNEDLIGALQSKYEELRGELKNNITRT